MVFGFRTEILNKEMLIKKEDIFVTQQLCYYDVILCLIVIINAASKLQSLAITK